MRLIDRHFITKLKCVAPAIFLACALLVPRAVMADGWHASISDHDDLPPMFLAVDKS